MTRRSFESSTLSRGLVVGRRLLAVDGDQELVAVDPAEPVEHEVGEEQMAQGAGQRSPRPAVRPACTTSRPQSWIRVSPFGAIAAA